MREFGFARYLTGLSRDMSSGDQQGLLAFTEDVDGRRVVQLDHPPVRVETPAGTPPAEAAVAIASAICDAVRADEPLWPECPAHPGGHALAPGIRASQTVWQCPSDDLDLVVPLGSWRPPDDAAFPLVAHTREGDAFFAPQNVVFRSPFEEFGDRIAAAQWRRWEEVEPETARRGRERFAWAMVVRGGIRRARMAELASMVEIDVAPGLVRIRSHWSGESIADLGDDDVADHLEVQIDDAVQTLLEMRAEGPQAWPADDPEDYRPASGPAVDVLMDRLRRELGAGPLTEEIRLEVAEADARFVLDDIEAYGDVWDGTERDLERIARDAVPYFRRYVGDL